MKSFAEIVGIGPNGVVSIVGAGGKTSLMFHLAGSWPTPANGF